MANDIVHEAGRLGPGDDPMVEGEGKGNNLAGHDRPVTDHRFLADLSHAEDRYLGIVDDRGSIGPSDHAIVGDGEAPPLELGQLYFALFRPLTHRRNLLRQLQNALLVRVSEHENHETVRGVDSDPDVIVFFQDDLFRFLVQGRIQVWVDLQPCNHGPHDKGKIGQPGTLFFDDLFLFMAYLFKIGNIGLVHKSDRRNTGSRFSYMAGAAATHPSKRNALERSMRDRLRDDLHDGGVLRHNSFGGSFDVPAIDSAVWTGPLYLREINAQFFGQNSNGRDGPNGPSWSNPQADLGFGFLVGLREPSHD